MKRLFLLVFILAIAQSVRGQAPSDEIKLLAATGNPMQYYVSLPKSWSTSKKWPAVVIFEAAEKEYKANLERFVAARGDLPFILIAPIHTGNGNQGRRDPKLFPYSTETWDYIDKVGDCKFNEEGLNQIFTDCKKTFNTEDKFYITGFEAGTHVLWYLVFHHPEYLKAAVPVAGNYRGRCIDGNTIKSDPSVPIVAFVSDQDEAFGPSSQLYGQWTEAKNLALKNGYKNVTETIIKGKGHVPMPVEVLNYFSKLAR